MGIVLGVLIVGTLALMVFGPVIGMIAVLWMRWSGRRPRR